MMGGQPPLALAFPRFLSYGWALVPIRRGEKAPDLDLLRDMYGDTRIAHLRYAPALAGEVERTRLAIVEPDRKLFPPEPFRYVGGSLIRRGLLAKDAADDEGRTPGAATRFVASLPRHLGLRLPR